MTYKTAHLNGLESVEAIGWPYHGKTTVNYAGGSIVSETISGQSGTPLRTPIRLAHALHHHPVRFSNLTDGWQYCFLYGVPTSDIFGFGTGENLCAISATTGDTRLVGAQVRVGSAVRQFAVYKTVGSMSLVVQDVRTRASHTLGISLGDISAAKYLTYNTSQTDSRMATAAELASAEFGQPTMTAVVLDSFNNRLLVSAEPTGVAGSLTSWPDTLDATWLPDRDGYKRPPSIAELGRTILALYEITFDASFTPTVTRVYSHADVVGAVTRVSPAGATDDGDKQLYSCSTEVAGAIVDASYSAGGSIVPTMLDIKHSINRWAYKTIVSVTPAIGDTIRYEACETEYTITRGAASHSKKLKHENTVRKVDSGLGFQETETKLSIDDVAVETVTGRVQYHNVLFQPAMDRAPWAGHETMHITLGAGLIPQPVNPGIAGTKLPVTPYSVSITNTRSGCLHAMTNHTLYRVAASGFAVEHGLHAGAVISGAGASFVAGLSAPGMYSGGINLFAYRGTAGRQFQNPVTGELSGGSTSYPAARINFR